jgi:branched-chain amino acid transport system ATP-binding protein
MAARLVLNDVSLRFGGIKVLEEVSFEVEPGAIFGLVGPNGAGKTSLFNCISGHYKPTSGTIRIDETEVQGSQPSALSRHGLARTFQHPALQLHSTVLENVLLGAHTRLPGGPVDWALRLPRTGRSEKALRAEARDLLDRNGLGWAADVHADELSHGLHKGIELCRALLSKPRLLLLDEPAAGLNRGETTALAELIRAIAAQGVTVLLIEHDMSFVMNVADRVAVLDFGRLIAQGTPAEVQKNKDVIAAYLGTMEAAHV